MSVNQVALSEDERSNASDNDSDGSILLVPFHIDFDFLDRLRDAGGVLPNLPPGNNQNANNERRNHHDISESEYDSDDSSLSEFISQNALQINDEGDPAPDDARNHLPMDDDDTALAESNENASDEPALVASLHHVTVVRNMFEDAWVLMTVPIPNLLSYRVECGVKNDVLEL